LSETDFSSNLVKSREKSDKSR
jgi:hypothetical protein